MPSTSQIESNLCQYHELEDQVLTDNAEIIIEIFSRFWVHVVTEKRTDRQTSMNALTLSFSCRQ